MPRMTVSEAEDTISRVIGNRPIRVTAPSQRSLVRKWLVARGMKSGFAYTLDYGELSAAYNAETDFARLRLKEAEWLKNHKSEAEAEESSEAEAEASAPPAPSLTSGAGIFENMIFGIVDQRIKAGLNASEIGKIVDAKIAESGVFRHDITLRADSGVVIGDMKSVHKMLATYIRVAASRQGNGYRPNIMVKGETGSGKTHAFFQVCKALDLEPFTNGSVSQDHQLLGFRDAGGTYHETPLRKAFGRKAGYCFDEIDGSENSPLLAIAQVLANNGADFPDIFVERHPDSLIVANGNTWGLGATNDFVGRARLDGAIRSRFPARITWNIDERLEAAMCGNPDWAHRVQKARLLARKAGLKVIIDPRMSQAGAALIANGFSFDEAAELTYLADLTDEQKKMVAV